MKSKKCIIDIETTTFIPWDCGRIICIGIKNIQTKEIKIFQHKNEESLLMEFLRYFQRHLFEAIIGYNISYDIRFLFSRCLKYNLPAPQLFNCKKIDLMKILKSVNGGYDYNKPGTLDQWSRFLFSKSKTYSNTEIPDLYKTGMIDEIIAYNQNDLELTYQLWKRINNIIGYSMG